MFATLYSKKIFVGLLLCAGLAVTISGVVLAGPSPSGPSKLADTTRYFFRKAGEIGDAIRALENNPTPEALAAVEQKITEAGKSLLSLSQGEELERAMRNFCATAEFRDFQQAFKRQIVLCANGSCESKTVEEAVNAAVQSARKIATEKALAAGSGSAREALADLQILRSPEWATASQQGRAALDKINPNLAERWAYNKVTLQQDLELVEKWSGEADRIAANFASVEKNLAKLTSTCSAESACVATTETCSLVEAAQKAEAVTRAAGELRDAQSAAGLAAGALNDAQALKMGADEIAKLEYARNLANIRVKEASDALAKAKAAQAACAEAAPSAEKVAAEIVAKEVAEREAFVTAERAIAESTIGRLLKVGGVVLKVGGVALRIVSPALNIKFAHDIAKYVVVESEQVITIADYQDAMDGEMKVVSNIVMHMDNLWSHIKPAMQAEHWGCKSPEPDGASSGELLRELYAWQEELYNQASIYDAVRDKLWSIVQDLPYNDSRRAYFNRSPLSGDTVVLNALTVGGSNIVYRNGAGENGPAYDYLWNGRTEILSRYIKQAQDNAPSCTPLPDCPASPTPPQPAPSNRCYNIPYNPINCTPAYDPAYPYSSSECAPSDICAESCSVTTEGPNAGQIGGDTVAGCRNPAEINRIYNTPGVGRYSFLVPSYGYDSGSPQSNAYVTGKITDFMRGILNGARPNSIVVPGLQGSSGGVAASGGGGIFNAIGNFAKNAASAVGDAVKGAAGVVGNLFGGATPPIAPNNVYKLDMNVTIPAGRLKNLQYKSQAIPDKAGTVIGTVRPSVDSNGGICFNIVTSGRLGPLNFVDASGKIISSYASPQGTCIQQQPQQQPRTMTVWLKIRF